MFYLESFRYSSTRVSGSSNSDKCHASVCFLNLFDSNAWQGFHFVQHETIQGICEETWSSYQVTLDIMVLHFTNCILIMLISVYALFSTIVMHVSRYWAAYKSEYVNKYGDNEITFQLAFGSDYSLEKLQLEYDQFFIRASQQILSAHKYVCRCYTL